MNKQFKVMTSLFLALVLVFLSVAPALATGPRYLTLIDMAHWEGKGFVLKFESTHPYDKQELKGGYVKVGSNEFGMNCNIDDSGIIVCVAGNGIAQFAGRQATVVLAGQLFYISVPARVSSSIEYCYDIYGLMTDDFDGFVEWMEFGEGPLGPQSVVEGQAQEESDLLGGYWYPSKVGRICSDTKPQLTDIVNFEHPYEKELQELLGEDFYDFWEFFGDDFVDMDFTSAVFLDESWMEVSEFDPDDPFGACYINAFQNIPAYYGFFYLIFLPLFNDCGGILIGPL
jgi:hypothetical protein